MATIGARHGWQAIKELPARCTAAAAVATMQLMAHYMAASTTVTSPGQQSALLASAVAVFLDAAPHFAAACEAVGAQGGCASATLVSGPGEEGGLVGGAERHAAEGEVLSQLRAVLLQWLKVLSQQKPALVPSVKAMYRIALLAKPDNIAEAVQAQRSLVEGCTALKAILKRARSYACNPIAANRCKLHTRVGTTLAMA
jgi:hypothetical protein